jgi:predicted permease
VLLHPLPYPESDRLIGLWHTAPGLDLDRAPQSIATYLLYRDHRRQLEDIALYSETMANLTGGDAPERLPAAEITASLFPVLRVAPRLGRAFTEEDERPGASSVVIVSDRLWRERLGADRASLGSVLTVNGFPTEVIGVMPAGFAFPDPAVDLWLPLEIDATRAVLGRFGYPAVARLADGTTLAAAEADLNGLLSNLEDLFPDSGSAPVLAAAGFAVRAHPLRDDLIGDVGGVLWNLFGAVGAILLIACANVANLLVVRGDGRRRETAIETALGSPKSRLIGAVLVESLLLGLAAGLIGLVLAYCGLELLLRFRPVELPRMDELGIDGTVLAFAALLSVVTSVLFGLLPALRNTAPLDLASELRGGGRTLTMDRGGRRIRQLLVGAQVALALILLAGSSLMVRSFVRLVNTDPGFRAGRVLTFLVALPENEFSSDDASARFFQQLIERLAGLPGVESVGAVSELPLSGSASAKGHALEEFPVVGAAPPPVLGFRYVSSGYFEAMGIPVLEGRALQPADHEQRTGAVVINDKLAKRYWPAESAVGKRLRPTDEAEAGWYTVVGVVGDVRNIRLTEPPQEVVYYPMLAKAEGAWTVRRMYLALRTASEPQSLIGTVRREVRALAPNLPIADVRTMEQLVARAQARMSFSMLMFLLSAAVAVTLGAVGIYGFVSYLVSQRTREIGIRMAIGAAPEGVRWMILRDALWIGLGGAVAGLLVSVVLSRWFASLLFEVSPLDPLTFTAMPVLLIGIVLLASYLPAARAARLPPVIALQRQE